MWHIFLALREIFSFTSASWQSRIVAAYIRLARIKELRWGSPARVRQVVDNRTPVEPDPALRIPSLVIERKELSDSLVNGPVFDIQPASRSFTGTVVYLHGGAYIHQPGPKQWLVAKRLALEHSCRVIFPIYPKGPTYTFRDAYPHMVKLLEQVSSNAPNRKYLLMGDSAGGGFAIGLALALRDQDKLDSMPTELVLSSPWTDIALDTPELLEQNIRDPWLNLEGLREASRMWTGYRDEELHSPLASPVYGDFARGIPKISMSIGTRELLYYDQLKFWEKLRKESGGLSCGRLVVGYEMVHVYAIAGDMPETVEPWRDISAAVKRLQAATRT